MSLEQELDKILTTHLNEIKAGHDSVLKDSLLVAFRAEMRRVIGERQLGTSIDMPANATQVQALMEGQTYSPHIVARNNLRHEQYKRAGIEPDKDRDE